MKPLVPGRPIEASAVIERVEGAATTAAIPPSVDVAVPAEEAE
jgi:hypothetical protein